MKKTLLLFSIFICFFDGISQTNPVIPYLGVATGTNNYSVTIGGPNNPSSPKTGQSIIVKAQNPNSGASTLRVTAGTSVYPVKPITQNTSALVGGEIISNTWNQYVYDTLNGGQWQFIGRTIGTYTGSVTNVSVVTANGVSGTVADPTTTPAITLSVTPNVTVATGTLSPTAGGTGVTSVATGDILYGSAPNVWSKLADVSAGSYLRSGGVTTAPLWSTLKLPNTTDANEVLFATSANVIGSSPNFRADGQTLMLGPLPISSAPIALWSSKSYAGEQQIRVTNNNAGTTSEALLIADNGSAQSRLRILGTGYATNGIFQANRTILESEGSALVLHTTLASPIIFGSTVTERMRLTSSGYLGIGTSIPLVELDVNGTGNIPVITSTSVVVTNNSTSSAQALTVVASGDNATTVTTTGAVIKGQYGLTSVGAEFFSIPINGGIGNAGIFNATSSNPLGFNNGVGAFAQNAKYNTAGTFGAIGGTNAVALTISASGASTINTALNIASGSISLNGNSGTVGQVLTSAGTGTPTWSTPPSITSGATNSQFDATSNTLLDVPGLTATLGIGTYRFEAVLHVTANVTGGHAYCMGGTATSSNLLFQINSIKNSTNTLVINSRKTSLFSAAGEASGTTYYTEIKGTITVSVAGTLTVQFSQNVASGTSSVLVGSTFEVIKIQ